jgi:hypothetical protein
MLQLGDRQTTKAAPTLLDRLGTALDTEGVVSCQWKGHWKRTRWQSGAGDVDLLVDPAWVERLEGVLDRLGFKPAVPPPEAQVPGTASWFGYDVGQQTLVHVHVHVRLILGGYWTTAYRLPIERAVLDSVLPRSPFAVPAPELEFLIFVLRMVQRYGVSDLVTPGRPKWLAEARTEFAYLLAQVDRRRLVARLAELLPTVDTAFFDACARSVRSGASPWQRVWLRLGLHRRLGPYAYRPPFALLLRRVGRRLRLFPRAGGLRLAHGGSVVALLGGDGAGKSTCVAELDRWLGPPFCVMTAHLGRPRRTLTTLVIGGLLKACRALGRALSGDDDEGGDGGPGVLELLRLVCTARDRYRLFTSARRFAAAGGIALCERYPVPQNRLLVGPEIPRLLGHGRDTPLARRLLRAEQWYYRQITPPDAVIVLMVEPELAVRRKTDEPADYVRARSRIIWETDWSGTGAHLMDAGRALPAVLADLKAVVWAEV